MTIKYSKSKNFLKKLLIKTAFLWAYRPNDDPLKISPKFFFRGLSVRFRILPSFLIVGAAKCGTTSLYNYLIQHEMISPSIRKEVNFWNQYPHFGLNWYRGNFPIKSFSKRMITGEATVNYLKFPSIAKKIKSDLPHVKIIILLRNPVDRTYSDYNYQVNRNKREDLSFEDALTFETFRAINPYWYRTHSIYIDEIKPYFDVFPKDQILILDFNELIQNPQKLMDEVCEFLKIPKKNDWNFQVYNALEYKQNINPKTKKWLTEFFSPHNEKLFKFLNRRFNWN